MPNPTMHSFTLIFSSKSSKQVIIKVRDAIGRHINIETSAPNSANRIGDTYRPGIYFAELVQGKERVIVKLIKSSD